MTIKTITLTVPVNVRTIVCAKCHREEVGKVEVRERNGYGNGEVVLEPKWPDMTGWMGYEDRSFCPACADKFINS